MYKKELIEIYERANMTLPFQMIFDLWEDTDDIPLDYIKQIITPPESKPFVIYGNKQFFKELEKAMDGYFNDLKNDNE